jgi:hypothetical protein
MEKHKEICPNFQNKMNDKVIIGECKNDDSDITESVPESDC